MSDSDDLNYFKATIYKTAQSLSFPIISFSSYRNYAALLYLHRLCLLYSNIIVAMNINTQNRVLPLHYILLLKPQ